MIKECPICGSEYHTKKRSQVYCSEECRFVRNREYDRLRKQKKRKKDRVIREQEKERIQKDKQLEKEEAERKHQEAIEQKLVELKAKAANGDPLARMTLAKKFSAEYWEAYSDYEIESNAEFENKVIRYVNGISVHDVDFVEKVMFTIEERGHILSELVASKI